MTEASASTSPLAIVTGASSGIGREVALQLSARRYRVLLVARRVDRLAAMAKEMPISGPGIVAVVDLADAAAIEPAMKELLRLHGPAEVLVNNAGAGFLAPFMEHTIEEHRRLMQVNHFSAVQMIQLVLTEMLRRKRGHVINIASISAKMAPWGHSGYTAAKAAMVAVTQTLAAEHAGSGVNFSYVNPGLIETEFFNNPGYSTADLAKYKKRYIPAPAAAKKIVALLDHPRLELCIPRHYRALDWIRAMSPALAHRIVAKQSRPGGK